MVKIKQIYLVIMILILCHSSGANDFTTPKNLANQPLPAAKKIKEVTLEQISSVLKKHLINLDFLLIELRAYLQDEFELALCGEKITLINSSSKADRQAYLEVIQELEEELVNDFKRIQDKIKRLKTLNLKAAKLKGS